jgi:hypothetical protein
VTPGKASDRLFFMHTKEQTPAEWLISRFEETLREYEDSQAELSGIFVPPPVGLGEIRSVIEVIEDHHPGCYVCGTRLLPDWFMRLPSEPPRYLQAGLPPV